ncbi:MAG: phosphatidate cytidylyltransferase [Candidatus Omnitrophica bacterium]|nr:phosphatidate cytidylyltransferase [Candidatus Omnitrophota bacterium]MDD5351862.1 phosphatidate cytidylyltransferase [Candidatus Omnitrophota bacterium]MDD5550688.1 phosphatidate cytidylyltransferase [Candidatus Omnitrophota bacterium]
MLTHRLISTIALVTITILALFYNPFFILLILLLTFGGLYEFFSLVEKKGVPVYKYFGTIVGLIIPLSIFYRFELTKGWELLFIVIGLISLFVLQIVKKDNSQALFSISATIFGILYISWLFSFMVKIRLLPHGAALLGALIFITKVTDIGAYLIGTRFGKHILLPKISPKKSIEGSIGGLFFAVLAALASKSFLPDIAVFSYINLIFIGFSLGIVTHLGDLSESLIKRDCLAKDSSYVFPGIGGVMDLIDSLLFTAPVFYFYIYRVLSQ